MMRSYLKSFNILTDEEIDSLEDMMNLRTLKKGDFFIKEGTTCKEVAFISSGLFRSYYYSSKGEEVTYCFTFKNSFLTAYSSFITQTATEENIQALSDIEMYSIPKQTVDQLENSSPNWLKLFKILAEQEYLKMEKRIFILQNENADKRYKDLVTNYPDYLQLIPLNYLASYLGITQRHLSRLRASFSN